MKLGKLDINTVDPFSYFALPQEVGNYSNIAVDGALASSEEIKEQRAHAIIGPIPHEKVLTDKKLFWSFEPEQLFRWNQIFSILLIDIRIGNKRYVSNIKSKSFYRTHWPLPAKKLHELDCC